VLRWPKRWITSLALGVVGSVKNWLTLLFLAVVILGVALAYAYVVPGLENRLVHQKLNDLAGNSGLVESVLQATPTGPLDANLTWSAQVVDTRINARIVIIDEATKGKIVDSRPGQPLDIAKYPVIGAAIRTSRTTVAATNVDGVPYATCAFLVQVYASSGLFTPRPAVVLVSTPLTDLQRAVQSVQKQILSAGLIAIVVTVIAGYLASYFIARRLKRIERGALSIASGDFSRQVRPGPPDEIGQLAVTFNTMGSRLREAFSQIEREKENMEVMLYDLAEGVVGVTAEGTLATANPAAEQLLRRALKRGAALAQILPGDVAQTLAETQIDGVDRTVVVVLGDRSLEASVYRVGGEAEVRDILVLRDITEQARLDQARRDFIATASHELKTPIFSLSGFMELLDEGDLDPETETEFLALMRQQVDRLTDLSLSLLDLSQVDSGAVQLEPGDVDVTTLTRAVAAEFRAGAESRDVTIDVTGPEELPAVCDERRFAQVLRALLDNAVKFSPHGGRVTVDLALKRSDVLITVADQGPGIPHDELARVFERFYRGGDGANTSGTGLGLSIAQEMVELMGGALTVKSRSGAGAQFTISVPRVQG
jgi:two-component system sensor histidine kinase VicK